MSRVALSSDTSPDIEHMQVEAWRRMTPQQKAAIVKGLTQATFDLAIAGIQHRYPDASPQEQRLRLAIVTLGRDLAQKAFPEIATLDRDCMEQNTPVLGVADLLTRALTQRA